MRSEILPAAAKKDELKGKEAKINFKEEWEN
jgi:hypothetical protein